MSVLIKGMEMPTNCFLCPLSVLNENRLFCEVTRNEVLREKIDAECPLVPVPPHGDLIDRYDLKNKNIIIDYDEWDDTFEDGLLFVADLIDNAPTIIEAEEE